MGRAIQSKVRVVMSLHLPRQQHQRFAKAAKADAKSLAEFIRSAADARADQVLGAPVVDKAAAAAA